MGAPAKGHKSGRPRWLRGSPAAVLPPQKKRGRSSTFDWSGTRPGACAHKRPNAAPRMVSSISDGGKRRSEDGARSHPDSRRGRTFRDNLAQDYKLTFSRSERRTTAAASVARLEFLAAFSLKVPPEGPPVPGALRSQRHLPEDHFPEPFPPFGVHQCVPWLPLSFGLISIRDLIREASACRFRFGFVLCGLGRTSSETLRAERLPRRLPSRRRCPNRRAATRKTLRLSSHSGARPPFSIPATAVRAAGLRRKRVLLSRPRRKKAHGRGRVPKSLPNPSGLASVGRDGPGRCFSQTRYGPTAGNSCRFPFPSAGRPDLRNSP